MTDLPAQRFRPAHLLAAVLWVVGWGLVGCSSDSDSGDAADNADPEQTSTAISGDTGDLKDPEGAIAALSDFTCEPGKGRIWSAEGTLTNNAESRTRFLVTVSVIRSKSHEVLGDVEKTYSLKAGADQQITLDEIYDKDSAGLECVPRVISGK